jgi:ubiquinone/menaquinone biosynthesis C-methylase UbiE
MTKERIPEKGEGIRGEEQVRRYDVMQRRRRDMGILGTDAILEANINSGVALEIGPGPGYLGLEWLSKTKNTKLNWLEISDDMMKIAQKNVKEYGFEDRVNWVISDATKSYPFADNCFDCAFSAGSLHEWQNPVEVFNEVYRVLKSGGKLFISDLKRNISSTIFEMMVRNVNMDEAAQYGLKSSIESAYLKDELMELLSSSVIKEFSVTENPFGLAITANK